MRRNVPRARSARQEILEEYSFLARQKPNFSNGWLIDSGASSHMCANVDLFYTLDNTVKQEVSLADGRTTSCAGMGSCRIVLRFPDGSLNRITLAEVLYVPELKSNLISVKKFASKEAVICFDTDGCRILKLGKVIGAATMTEGLYSLNMDRDILINTWAGGDEYQHGKDPSVGGIGSTSLHGGFLVGGAKRRCACRCDHTQVGLL